MSYNYDTQDPTFLADLERSKGPVNKTADFFSGRGFPVVVAPTFVRPDASQMSEYADDGDLQIMVTCEVKQRPHLSFTCKEDFKYKTVIVDTVSSFDKKRPIPFYYIIWNKDCSTFILVDVHRTKGKWVKRKKHDRLKNRDRYFYEVDIALCSFVTP